MILFPLDSGKVMIPQAVRCGYTVRAHEELQVFRKCAPDVNTIGMKGTK